MKKLKKFFIYFLVLFVLIVGISNALSKYKLLQIPMEKIIYNINFSDFSGIHTYEELIENNVFAYTKMSDMHEPFSFYDLTKEQSDIIEQILSNYNFDMVYYDSSGSGSIHYPDNCIVFSYNPEKNDKYNFVEHSNNIYSCGINSVTVTKEKVLISRKIIHSDWIINNEYSDNGMFFENEILISYESTDKQLLNEINEIINEIKIS